MKVTFPKDIKKGFLSSMTINVGPLSITIVQLLLLAVGIGLGLAIFTSLKDKSGSLGALIAAGVVVLIFIIVAFFKISEMGILEYTAKILRNKFFDVQKKFQVNNEKNDETEIAIKEAEQNLSNNQVIDYKSENKEDQEKIMKEIEKSGLI